SHRIAGCHIGLPTALWRPVTIGECRRHRRSPPPSRDVIKRLLAVVAPSRRANVPCGRRQRAPILVVYWPSTRTHRTWSFHLRRRPDKRLLAGVGADPAESRELTHRYNGIS